MSRPAWLKNTAQRAAPQRASDAWFYENVGSIDVLIVPPEGGDAVSCRISKRKLADWLGREQAAMSVPHTKRARK